MTSRTSASVGVGVLRKAGEPDESLQTVPSRMIDWDTTYSAAIALRDWIQKREPSVQRINVVTEDTRARRTRLLFQKAFGKNVQVGIIAVANVDYPANQWWHYSEGLKDVVSEFAAYLVCPVSVLPLISGATSSARSSRFDRLGPETRKF